MIPPGGAVAAGADDLDLPRKIANDIDSYPRFPHNQVRLLLFAVEHYPLICGYRRRFSALPDEERPAFLTKLGHSERSAVRRLVYSYLKSIVFGAFVSHPDVEKVIGYRYECVKPRGDATPEEQIHH